MIRTLFLALVLLWPLVAYAADPKPQHAIAMHGEPRYAAGFDHLDYVNADAPKGGVLRRAEVGTFDNLNPYLITGRVTSGLQEALLLTYDSLMVQAWNEPFTLYGLVAESVVVPEDRSSIEFHLNPKAKFHDGHPITTEDVAFTFDQLKQFGRPNQRRIYGLVSSVNIRDARTIKFNLRPGFDRETVMILAKMPVVPKHYWVRKPFDKTTLKPPLTSGPYQIKDLKPGQEITFERAKDYWAKDLPINRGLYNFDALRYDFFRDDKAALQALAAGQADLRREWSPVTWERDYDFKSIKDGQVIKENFANGRPARARFFVYNMRRPIFADINTRKALAYAFDFEWINKSLFLGTQTRINSLFMNSELAYNGVDKIQLPKTDGSGLLGLRNNLREAATLLKAAGWEIKNGVLVGKDGKPFQFEILLNDPSDEKVALEYSRALERLGIKTTIRTVDTAQYIGRMSQFDFDMTISFWRNSLSPGTEQAVYWGSKAADQEGSFNYSGLKSPEVDHLIAAITQSKVRVDLVKAAQKLDQAVMASWIGVPLFDATQDRVAYTKALAHPGITPLYGPVIESWWYNPQKSGKEDSKDLPPQ